MRLEYQHQVVVFTLRLFYSGGHGKRMIVEWGDGRNADKDVLTSPPSHRGWDSDSYAVIGERGEVCLLTGEGPDEIGAEEEPVYKTSNPDAEGCKKVVPAGKHVVAVPEHQADKAYSSRDVDVNEEFITQSPTSWLRWNLMAMERDVPDRLQRRHAEPEQTCKSPNAVPVHDVRHKLNLQVAPAAIHHRLHEKWDGMDNAQKAHQQSQPPMQHIQLLMSHSSHQTHQIRLHPKCNHKWNHSYRNHPSSSSKRWRSKFRRPSIIWALHKHIEHRIRETCNYQTAHSDRYLRGSRPSMVCECAGMCRYTIIRAAPRHLHPRPSFVAAIVYANIEAAPVESDIVVVEETINHQDSHDEEDPSPRMDVASSPWPF